MFEYECKACNYMSAVPAGLAVSCLVQGYNLICMNCGIQIEIELRDRLAIMLEAWRN